MITKEDFCDFIKKYQMFNEAIQRMEEGIGCNLFECDWYNYVGELFDIFVNSNFTEEGCDLVNWWMFEDVNHIIYDNNKNLFDEKIEYDVNKIEDLWKYLYYNKLEYFKNVE